MPTQHVVMFMYLGVVERPAAHRLLPNATIKHNLSSLNLIKMFSYTLPVMYGFLQCASSECKCGWLIPWCMNGRLGSGLAITLLSRLSTAWCSGLLLLLLLHDNPLDSLPLLLLLLMPLTCAARWFELGCKWCEWWCELVMKTGFVRWFCCIKFCWI